MKWTFLVVTTNNNELSLSTAGRKLRVQVNPEKKKPPIIFSAENLDNYQVNTASSHREMKKFTNFLRCNAGKKSVPAFYENHMREKANALESIYKEGIYEFDTSCSTSKEKRPVIWADAEELLDTVIEKRNLTLTEGINIKVMADGGQGFFKICLSIFSEEDLSQTTDEKRRRLYSEGGTTGLQNVTTSVNRLLMCIVPKVAETYANIEILFKLTNINNIPFKFTSDFKILLIVNGQQTATATFPCPYCFITLDNLRDPNFTENVAINKTSDDVLYTEAGGEYRIDYPLSLKTYGDVQKAYEFFCAIGKNKEHAKLCYSTINPPLFIEKNDLYVIQKCPLPELHILQGYVNHLFWDGLIPLVGREKALLWPRKLKLVPKSYQGEIFEGNACRALLKQADKLLDPEIYEECGPLKLVPYVSAFKAMDKIVNKFFSSKKVDSTDSELNRCVKELKKAFEATSVSKTLKIHVVVDHLADCLRYLNGNGLGCWSEQAGESIHRKFLIYWDKYKTNMIDDESYSRRLKKAVVEFSSQRI